VGVVMSACWDALEECVCETAEACRKMCYVCEGQGLCTEVKCLECSVLFACICGCRSALTNYDKVKCFPSSLLPNLITQSVPDGRKTICRQDSTSQALQLWL